MSERMSYVARCKCGCGKIVFACVDDPDDAKGTAREIARVIREGYVIERMTVAEVRAADWGNCENRQKATPAKQEALAL